MVIKSIKSLFFKCSYFLFFVTKKIEYYEKFRIFLWNIYNRIKWKKIELLIIVWPPAYSISDEIMQDISRDFKILNFDNYEIDENIFEQMVQEIYKIDSASPDKIILKLKRLKTPPLQLKLVRVLIKFPKMVSTDGFNQRILCEDVKKLKTKIREKYKSRIKNYIYDIIIHSAEVDDHNDKIKSILEKSKLKDA